MHNRMPSRRRQDVTKGKSPRQGDTVPVQGKTPDRVPRTPDKRDKSADSQSANEPSGRGMARAAREDIERGVVGTSKGPVLDETCDKAREDTADPLKKFSP